MGSHPGWGEISDTTQTSHSTSMDMAPASKVCVGAAGGAPGARRRWQRGVGRRSRRSRRAPRSPARRSGEVGSHQDLLAFGDQCGNLGELGGPVLAQIGTAYLKDENSYERSEAAYVEMRAGKVDCELRVPHFSVAPCPSFF